MVVVLDHLADELALVQVEGSRALPAFKAQPFWGIIISQRRVNVGFVFVGDAVMTGEANMSFVIPPASASTCPFAQVDFQGQTFGLESWSVDGSAAETINVSGLRA